MSAIAHEVSRRMTPEYAKERAREMARHRAEQVKERAVDNPWLVPLIGAGVGALVGRAIISRAQDHRYDGRWTSEHDRRWSGESRGAYGAYGYPRDYGSREYGSSDDRYAVGAGAYRDDLEPGAASSEGAGIKERVSEKAGEMTDRLREGTSALRERLPDRERIRSSTYEDAGLWALGAVALGALFGFVLPVSERERELLEPAKEKLREAASQATETALDKGNEALDKAQQKMGATRDEDQERDRGTLGPGIIDPNPPTPIH